MTPNEYQKAALRTATRGQSSYDRLINGALGLAGECGEVADHIKKFLYQGHQLDMNHLIEELGDCLWYVSLTLKALDCDMETCMALNIDKLRKRYPAGFDPERSMHREGDI